MRIYCNTYKYIYISIFYQVVKSFKRFKQTNKLTNTPTHKFKYTLKTTINKYWHSFVIYQTLLHTNF